MGMAELDAVLRLVEEHDDEADFVGPREESLIEAAEQALGLRFPPTYRRFLLELGTGGFDGEEIYGIISEDLGRAGVPNAIWLTLDERQSSGLPGSMVTIYNDGMGGFFVLDTAKPGKGGEPPVEVWQPGASQPDDTLEVVGDDFGIVALQLFSEALGL